MTKILVVEDDKFLLNAYKIKLSKLGLEIKTAMDGEEALLVLKDFTPNLILLDLIMPKRDGFYVLEQLKNNPSWKDIPVIVTSNLGQKGDMDKVKSLGAVDYIVKSDVSLGDIMNKISSFLKLEI